MFLQKTFIKIIFFLDLFLFLSLFNGIISIETARNNGDVFVVDMENVTVTEAPQDLINFDEIMQMCNSSFSIPMSYLDQFNEFGELPDLVDKTGMCFIRCLYEKSGLIDNWKVNGEKIRANLWPATGDSIDFCEQQQRNEINACVRAYAIAKCLMIRAIVDARNKSIV